MGLSKDIHFRVRLLSVISEPSNFFGAPPRNWWLNLEFFGAALFLLPAQTYTKVRETFRRGIYVCMLITYSKGKYQPGKVANPARGQLDRKNKYFPVLVRA